MPIKGASWKYLEGGNSKVKHAFYAPSRISAICGVGIPWYTTEKWKFDKEGLELRPECLRCVRMIER